MPPQKTGKRTSRTSDRKTGTDSRAKTVSIPDSLFFLSLYDGVEGRVFGPRVRGRGIFAATARMRRAICADVRVREPRSRGGGEPVIRSAGIKMLSSSAHTLYLSRSPREFVYMCVCDDEEDDDRLSCSPARDK